MKPTVICEYNSHMGGVDTADHNLTSYGFNRKLKNGGAKFSSDLWTFPS